MKNCFKKIRGLEDKKVSYLNDNSLSSYPPNIIPSKCKSKAFTKPSRATNEVRDEQQATETLSFRCCCERWRLMRGAVAFTLAEVLITLGIIGVVAAITMPTLIAKFKEQQTVVQLKRLYSIISQGYQKAILENGSPDNWGISENSTEASSLEFIEKLKPYFKIVKVCNYEGDCFAKYSRLNSTTKNFSLNTNRAYGVLNDGTSIWIYVYDKDCHYSVSDTDSKLQNICAEFKVDINGLKNPNMYGKDVFAFYLTNNTVIPVGTANEDYNSFDNRCTADASITSNGDGCAAWVIYNGNMDYLHCPDDLSWNGKTKCN